MTHGITPTLVALLASTTHEQPAWRAAASRRDLQARLADAPLLPIAPPATRQGDLTVVRFYGDATGTSWAASSAESVPTRSMTRFGPIQVRVDRDELDVSLRQTAGQPRRADISLGAIRLGEGLQVAINWRQPAKASGGPTVYMDHLVMLMWTGQDWEMARPSQLAESMPFRDVDLRAVLY